MDLDFSRAVDAFAAGFSYTRSQTHPFLTTRIAPGVLRLHDGPRRKPEFRNEEFLAHGVEPAVADALAREHAAGRYFVCYLLPDGADEAPIRAEFKALRYRLISTEFFFVHALAAIPTPPAPLPMVRVMTEEDAARLHAVTKKRQIPADALTTEPPPMRQYMALDGECPVAWVGSVAAAGCGWATNVYTEPEYRRRGIARALMANMLEDDRAAGFEASVLLASHAGALLYPTLGYEGIGKLLMYAPRRAE